MSDERGVPASTRWIDALKALAVLWIFLNHAVERVLGSPYIANPTANWPPLQARIAQLSPVDYGTTLASLVLNVLRYVGLGRRSGRPTLPRRERFWSHLESPGSGGTRELGAFFRRRLGRIYPLWWGAHLAFAIPSFLLGTRACSSATPGST